MFLMLLTGKEIDMLDMFTLKLKRHLSTAVLGRNVVHMRECGSTNDEAKNNTHYPHGTLFIADKQTAGRGRRGNSWVSKKGDGIYMSLLLKPDIPPENISQITLIAGIALCNAIGMGAMIKWPNDIVIGNKKVSGTLTEYHKNCVICGIGINVNASSFPEELHMASSLYLEGGKKLHLPTLTANILNEFEKAYERFLKTGFSGFSGEYEKLCVNIGKTVRVIHESHELIGVAESISQGGGINIKTPDGIKCITSGDVSIRGMYGYV